MKTEVQERIDTIKHEEVSMCDGEEVQLLRENNLCCNCVKESYLSDLIKNNGQWERCSYCDEKHHTFKLERVAELVDDAMKHHYYKTATEPAPFDHSFERDGDPVQDIVWKILQAKKDGIAEDICIILQEKHDSGPDSCVEEVEFADESMYAQKKNSTAPSYADREIPRLSADYEWREKWSAFKQSIKFEKRFFNPEAQSFLKELFAGITEASQTSRGLSVIERGGPGTALTHVYRARVFYKREDIENALCNPEIMLGPPPPSKARAGRMNPAGIALFYGADDPEVTLNEVRPIVGSSVMVARFKILRPMRILNLNALQFLIVAGSYFDPHYATCLSRKNFFPELWRDLLRPTMPGEEEMDYLPTQVIAEFLAASDGLNIDGIRHTSVQAGDKGNNIIFFHGHGDVRFVRRSKTLRVEWPLGIEDQPNVIVREDAAQGDSEQPEYFFGCEGLHNDEPEAPLQLDTSNIDIYHINGVSLKYSSQAVLWQVSDAMAQHTEPPVDLSDQV